jgi:hypothetical protein
VGFFIFSLNKYSHLPKCLYFLAAQFRAYPIIETWIASARALSPILGVTMFTKVDIAFLRGILFGVAIGFALTAALQKLLT